MTGGAAPYRVYLLDVSYFSGKLEAYLRWKGIPYERVEARWSEVAGVVRRATGVAKVPAVVTPDGTWLHDTTRILDWMEARHPEPAVLPGDPYQAFFCRLLEDWADEWLWRPALHYRWSFAPDARLLSHRIAAETLQDVPLPTAWLAAQVRWRQRRTYVRGDGVTPDTRAHVEGVYLSALERLQRLLDAQPFLLGGRPCLADFGLFASMFRHFALDPTPSRIMRERAPAVFAWVARLWNARAERTRGEWPAAGTIPDAWHELVTDAGTGYLPYLHANAVAWREGRRRFDVSLQGTAYRSLPVVRYRVWCRERLQDHLDAVPAASRTAVRDALDRAGALEPLLRDGRIESGLEKAERLPARDGWLARLARERDPWNPQ
jgi:glutathione S-transferase